MEVYTKPGKGVTAQIANAPRIAKKTLAAF